MSSESRVVTCTGVQCPVWETHLVHVEPALHHDHTEAAQPAHDEPALVTWCGADREVWDGAVGQRHTLLHQRRQAAQPGAADEAQHGRDVALPQDVVCYRLEALTGQRVGTGGGAEG